MDGVADVTQRIADIQSRLASMRPTAVPFADLLSSSSSAGTGAPTTADGATTPDRAAWAAATGRPGWAIPGAATAVGGTAGATTAGTGAGGGAGTGAVTGSATGASAPVSTARGVTIPEELRAFGNGRIPADALVKLGQGSHRLAAKAAAAWQRMEAAAAADGITLKVTDSYRDYATQVDLVRRKGLYSQGGLAARPGTSNHGWGLAVDLALDAKQQAWMRENGTRFGFVEDTPREPWHWGFHG